MQTKCFQNTSTLQNRTFVLLITYPQSLSPIILRVFFQTRFYFEETEGIFQEQYPMKCNTLPEKVIQIQVYIYYRKKVPEINIYSSWRVLSVALQLQKRKNRHKRRNFNQSMTFCQPKNVTSKKCSFQTVVNTFYVYSVLNSNKHNCTNKLSKCKHYIPH